MADINHTWGSDVSLSATGDVALVSGPEMTRQRILRRLLSNPATDDTAGDLLFSPEYGAGLPRRIGETTSPNAIGAIVRRQLMREAGLNPEPPPIVAVTPIFGGASLRLTYADAETGEAASIGFSLER